MGYSLWGLKELDMTEMTWHSAAQFVKSFPCVSVSKESACQCRRFKRCRFNSWVRKIPWRRAWQPTLVFLLGESHGQRSPVGYSPWSHKELDMTEQLNTAHIVTYGTAAILQVKQKIK